MYAVDWLQVPVEGFGFELDTVRVDKYDNQYVCTVHRLADLLTAVQSDFPYTMCCVQN